VRLVTKIADNFNNLYHSYSPVYTLPHASVLKEAKQICADRTAPWEERVDFLKSVKNKYGKDFDVTELKLFIDIHNTIYNDRYVSKSKELANAKYVRKYLKTAIAQLTKKHNAVAYTESRGDLGDKVVDITKKVVDISCSADNRRCAAGCYESYDVAPLRKLVRRYEDPKDVLTNFNRKYAGKPVGRGNLTYSKKVNVNDIKKIKINAQPILNLIKRNKDATPKQVLEMFNREYAGKPVDGTANAKYYKNITVKDIEKIKKMDKGVIGSYLLFAVPIMLTLTVGTLAYIGITDYTAKKEAETKRIEDIVKKEAETKRIEEQAKITNQQTLKGKQNEAALNQLYLDIQNKDLDAITAGLARFNELKKDYDAKGGFRGTAAYKGDEEAFSNVEALIKTTLNDVGSRVDELLNPKEQFTLKNTDALDSYIIELENASADVKLLKVLGKDVSAEQGKALQAAYDARTDLRSIESFLYLTKAVGQKPEGIREFAKNARESLAGFRQDVYSDNNFLDALGKLGKDRSLGKFKESVDRHVRGQDPYWGWDVLSNLADFLWGAEKTLGSDNKQYRMIRAAAMDYVANSLENYKPKPFWKKILSQFKIWETIPLLAGITNPNAEGTIVEGIYHIQIPAEFSGHAEEIIKGLARLKSGDGTNFSYDIFFVAKEGMKLYFVGNKIIEVFESKEGIEAAAEGSGSGGGEDTIIPPDPGLESPSASPSVTEVLAEIISGGEENPTHLSSPGTN